jgi:hypothetical protein
MCCWTNTVLGKGGNIKRGAQEELERGECCDWNQSNSENREACYSYGEFLVTTAEIHRALEKAICREREKGLIQ